MAEPLSGQDRAFLAWESRTRPMHFSVVTRFALAPGAEPPSLADLRATLGQRIAALPRFRARPQRRRPWGPRVWHEVEDFDPDRHVAVSDGPHDDPGAARAALDALLARPLDPARPLWEVWLVPEPERARAFSIVFKVHHALLDGVAAAGLLERLLGDDAPQPRTRPTAAPKPRPSRRPSVALRVRIAALARTLGGFLRRGPRTALNGRVGLERQHRAWSTDASALRDFAKLHGATPNDAVLAAVARGVDDLVGEAEAHAPAPRAFCPVSLRGEDDAPGALGNRISFWLVDLPRGADDLAAALAETARSTGARRRRSDASGGASFAALVQHFGGWFAALGMWLAARRRSFQIVVTNVPGPSRVLSLAGARLDSIAAFPPLFPGQRCVVSVVHYDERLHWAIADGWTDAEPGDRLGRGIRASLAAALGPAQSPSTEATQASTSNLRFRPEAIIERTVP